VTAFFTARIVNSALGLRLDGRSPLPGAHSAKSTRATRTVVDSRPDHSIILSRNLFGLEQAASTLRPGADDSAPAMTVTGFTLRGTAATGDGEGYAVFESPEGKQGVFSVGEKIFDGPLLVSVSRRKAVVKTATGLLTVEITEPEPRSRSEAEQVNGSIRRIGADRFLVARSEIENSLDNLTQTITQVRATPFLQNGKAIGFRLFNVRKGSIFERMGIKNGDVVREVNGTVIDSPAAASGLLDVIRTAENLELKLLRQGKPLSLSYTVR
jgi:general secretion pathway protein C